MKKGLLLGLAACSISFTQVFGWGQKGHDTTAFIAENHLTEATRAAVDSLLDGRSIVYWANWLDNASHTPEYDHTKTWHYRNIDAGQEYDKAPLNPAGDVTTAINAQIGILTDPAASEAEKALALKILVHVMGDLHQPMHMGHLSDRGGNSWKIKYFNRDTNLHSIWDSNLVESAHKWTYTEWQQQLDRLTPAAAASVMAGTPEDWGRETFGLATAVYDGTPEGTNISYDYIARWTPVIEDQLLHGGLRLADLLNSIFDKDYTPVNSVSSLRR